MENLKNSKIQIAVALGAIGLLVLIALFSPSFLKKKEMVSGPEQQQKDFSLSKQAALKNFPVDFPLERGLDPAVEPKISGTQEKIITSYSYISQKKMSEIVQSFTSFYTQKKWKTEILQDLPTLKVISGTDQKTGTVILSTVNDTSQGTSVAFLLSQFPYSASELSFPFDFPKEKGAKVSERVINDKDGKPSSIVMEYISLISKDQNEKQFKNYFDKNGWTYAPGTLQTPEVSHLIASRLDAVIELMIGKSSVTNGKVGVVAKFTLFK